MTGCTWIIAGVLTLTALSTGTSAQTADSLYVTNGSHILLEGSGQTFTVLPVHVSVSLGRVVGLTVDVEAGFIFWSDVLFGKRGIYRADLNGANAKILLKDVLEVNSLTVDWSARNLYWTDAKRKTVEVSNYEGQNHRVLISGKMKQPRGIVADPVNSYLYWNDQGDREIERARLDGSERQVIRRDKLYWPNQMLINWDDSKLMWVDGANKTLMTSDLQGGNVRTLADLRSQAGNNPVFGLALKGSTAYVSVWETGKILAVSSSGSVSVFHASVGSAVFSLAVKSSSNPRAVDHVCSRNNGGCSHLCLPTSATRRRCACPSFGGKSLKAGGTTCGDPVRVLIFALGDLGQVCFVDLESPAPRDYNIITWALRPVAVAYDPVKQHVYYSDVFEKRIIRIKFDGTEKKVFLDRSFGIGTVDGLLVDWQNRRLFYSNMGFKSVGGYSFTWHKIDVVSLDDNSKRRTIVTDTDKPRALALDVPNGHLYWTDWGADPKLMRIDLDGSNMVTVRSGLASPNGIVIDQNQLYLLDSHYKNGNPPATLGGAVYAVKKTDGSLSKIKNLDLKTPFAMTFSSDNKMYISDWEQNAILEVTSTQWSSHEVSSVTPLFSNIGQPMGMVYTKRSEGSQESSNCDCDVCLGTRQQKTCSCSSYEGKILQSDKKSCQVPKNFLAFTDMNSVKLLSLDQPVSDRSVYTVQQQDSYVDNYVSLVYDPTGKHLYFSDVNRKMIYRSRLDGSGREVFYNASQLIDGMHLDVAGRLLYWTASVDGVIARVNLNNPGQTHTVLVSNLKKPRAIQVTSRYIYWTVWGGTPGIGRCNLDGTDVKTLISSPASEYLNALFVTDQELLYGDGKTRKIFTCSVEGTSCQELRYVANIPSHIFSIAKLGDFLYYSDWFAGTVSMVNLVTGTVRHVTSHLMRPSNFVIYTVNTPVCPADHGCQGRCYAYPGGYECGCSAGQHLKGDQKNCEPGTWQITNSVRCEDKCSAPHTVCALQESSTISKCQCKPGYHGNSTSCQACPPDKYKDVPGPGTCISCPSGSSTNGQLGQSSCRCQNNKRWMNGSCIDDDSVCPVSPVSPVCPASRQCDVTSSPCVTGQKCCSWGACGATCQPPLYRAVCVVSGTAYHVGGVPFIPDQCRSCQCEEQNTLTGKMAVANCRNICIKPTVDPNSVGPTFRNCPKNFLELTVPENADTVDYQTLQAFDGSGSPLPVTYDPPVELLKWKGLGESGMYEITASVKDKNGRQARCAYQVQVKDKSAPMIFCPSDITEYTEFGGKEVFWPDVVVSDNVDPDPVITHSHQQGAYFEMGKWTVKITARDASGNTESCSFFVEIIQSQAKFCFPHSVNHGSMGTSGAGKTEYRIRCRKPYVKHHAIADKYTCEGGHFVPPLSEHQARNACIKKKPFKVKQKLKVTILGCEKSKSYFNEVKKNVHRVFNQSPLSSDFSSITVECVSGSRIKRNDQTTVANFEASVPVSTTEAAARSQLKEGIDRLQRRLASGEEYFSIDQQKKRPTVTRNGNPTTGCNPGEVMRDGACYVCNSGTKRSDDNTCTPCTAGTYQNQDGQSECHPCPSGRSSEDGSYSFFQCKPVPPPRESFPLVTLIGGIVGGLLVIVVIIIIVVIIKRRRKPPADKMTDATFQNPAYGDEPEPTYETIPEKAEPKYEEPMYQNRDSARQHDDSRNPKADMADPYESLNRQLHDDVNPYAKMAPHINM